MAKNDKNDSKTEPQDTGTATPPVDGANAGENGGAPPPPAPPPPAVVHPYQIAPGKSLTVKRGVLNEGDEIILADLAPALKKPGATDSEKHEAAKKQLEHLVAKGYVVRGPAKG